MGDDGAESREDALVDRAAAYGRVRERIGEGMCLELQADLDDIERGDAESGREVRFGNLRRGSVTDGTWRIRLPLPPRLLPYPLRPVERSVRQELPDRHN